MNPVLAIALPAASTSSQAGTYQRDQIALRPAHTFSIVAMDPATGSWVRRCNRTGFLSAQA